MEVKDKRLDKMIKFDHRSAFNDEVDDRRDLVRNLLYTGVKQIDLAFKGILPNDLILLGAATGSGKTEMLTQIACNIACNGKKVDFFALEASKFEIHRRIKFKLYAAELRKLDKKINYSDWIRFKCENEIKLVESAVAEKLKLIAENLRIYYRDSSFDLNDFIKMYHYVKRDSSIVLVDHAQFFDFDDSKKTDNSFTKDMTLQMYDLVNNFRVPIVLVSHLRKLESEEVIPDIYDFFGSSELTKKATRVLVLKRYKYIKELNSWSTIFRFCKNRELDPVTMLTLFNSDLKMYSDELEYGTIVKDQFVKF